MTIISKNRYKMKQTSTKRQQIYRHSESEITKDHAVHPPLDDNIQLSLGEYRSVIYELIKGREQASLYEDSDSTPKTTPMNSRTASEASTSTRTQVGSRSQSHSELESSTCSTARNQVIKKKRTIFTLPQNKGCDDNREKSDKGHPEPEDPLENAFKIPTAKSAKKTHSLTSFPNYWSNGQFTGEDSSEHLENGNFRDIIKKYQGGKYADPNYAAELYQDIEENHQSSNTKQRESKVWTHNEKSLHRPPTAPYYGDPSRLQYSMADMNWQNSGDSNLVSSSVKAKINPSATSILDGLPYLNNMKMAPPPPHENNRKPTPTTPPNFDRNLTQSPSYDNYQAQNNRHKYMSSKNYNFTSMKNKAEKGNPSSSTKGAPGSKMNLGNRLDSLTAPKQSVLSRMGDIQQKVNSKIGLIDNSNRGVGSGSSLSYNSNQRAAGYTSGQQQKADMRSTYGHAHTPPKPYERSRQISKNKQSSTKNPHPKSYQSTWTQRNAEMEEANRRETANGRSSYFPDSIIKVNPLSTNPDNRAYPQNGVHQNNVNREFRIPKPPQRGKHPSSMGNTKGHLDKYSHNLSNSQNEATINASELYQLTSMSFSMKGKYGGNNL